jgi:hypothetical protein
MVKGHGGVYVCKHLLAINHVAGSLSLFFIFIFLSSLIFQYVVKPISLHPVFSENARVSEF